MARPVKNNVEYFPYYVREGRTMGILNHKYGNDGFATHIKLLAELAFTDYHYLDVSKTDNLIYLTHKCNVEESLLTDILTTMAKMGKLDLYLWENYSVIWCEDLVKSLSNVYDKRGNDCMNYESLRQHYDSSREVYGAETIVYGAETTSNTCLSDVNTQSKVKQSKVNIIKQVNNNQEPEAKPEIKTKPTRQKRIKKPEEEVNKNPPEWSEVWEYILSEHPNASERYFKAKYGAWLTNGWEDFKGNKIKNWKSKFKQQTAYEGALDTTNRGTINNAGGKPRITL